MPRKTVLRFRCQEDCYMKLDLRIIIILFAFTIILMLAGCASMATSTTQYKGMDQKLAAQDYNATIAQIEAAKDKEYKPKDKVLYYLDLGMLYHFAHQYEKSNELLTQAENDMADLYTKSISKAALSLLLNDNAMDYFGEDYEDIYVNVFKALNYLELNKYDDAFVEIRRINLKLSMLEDKYKKMADALNKSPDKKAKIETGTNQFYNDALGRYLSMLLYRTEGKLDDARIDSDKIQEAFDLQKNIYNFQKPDLSQSMVSTEGKAKVNVVSFIGKSPSKKANTMYITTLKDEVVITSVNKDIKQLTIEMPVDEGYHFKFSLPYMARNTSIVSKVKIVVDDGESYELAKMEDINTVAIETFKVKEPMIYMKSLTRAVVKGILAEKQKKKMEANNPGLGGKLLSFATDVGVDMTENADLRISRFFPGDALMGEMNVTPGDHTFKVNYYDANGTILYSENLGQKNIQADGLNLLETIYLR
jgi:uncharacterized protein